MMILRKLRVEARNKQPRGSKGSLVLEENAVRMQKEAEAP